MKEKLNKCTGLSSLFTLVHARKIKYAQNRFVAGVTGQAFAALKVLLSKNSGKYKWGVVSIAACLNPTPGLAYPIVHANGNRNIPGFKHIPCLTPATINIEPSSFISAEMYGILI